MTFDSHLETLYNKMMIDYGDKIFYTVVDLYEFRKWMPVLDAFFFIYVVFIFVRKVLILRQSLYLYNMLLEKAALHICYAFCCGLHIIFLFLSSWVSFRNNHQCNYYL